MVIATSSTNSVDSQSPNDTIVSDDRDRVINSNSLESVRSIANEVHTKVLLFHTRVLP